MHKLNTAYVRKCAVTVPNRAGLYPLFYILSG